MTLDLLKGQKETKITACLSCQYWFPPSVELTCIVGLPCAGIEKVFYLSDKRHEEDETKASRCMLDLAKIPYE